MRGSLLVVAFWSIARVASAQPMPQVPPVQSGAQTVPPIATATAGEPVLPQQLDGRRAVRGCPLGETCDRPGDQLREFEHEAFPAPGKDPWISERTGIGARSHLEPGAPRIVKKPSELRPDAPWLDGLELPDLPVRWTQKLVDYLVFYHDDPRGRAIMTSWLVAQGRYRDMILAHLRKAHLPADLLYVAMIESGYDPQDTSTAGALGLWQFMPEGGRIYGLREDRWVDERRDPYRSTIAQMDYFLDLQQRFASWDIALAAFNMGYGAMLRSIARFNTNDFYQLCELENGIPWETCLYSPKVLATAIVGKNRAAFGYTAIKEVAAESWDDVAVPVSLPLGVIAAAAGTTEAKIVALNPQLRHGRTPPGEVGYVVRVPAGAKAAFGQKLAELQSQWAGFDAYVMAHGERFEDVATVYGTSLAVLKKLNDVQHESEVTGGMVVVVPRISVEQREKNRAKAKSKLLGSGVDQKDGELLIVPVPDKDAKIAGKKRVFYRVVTGDSARSIAKAFGVSTSELIAWNGLDEDANLHPKMVLAAWVPTKWDADAAKIAILDDSELVVVTRGSAEHLDLAEGRTGRVRTTYVAHGKEKLADIARQFGMGSHDLARINRISYETVLKKGESIIVYQVTDPHRSLRADEQWKKTPRGMRGRVVGAKATTTASAADQAKAAAEPADVAQPTAPAATDDDATTPYDDDDKPDAKKSGPVTAPTSE